TSLTMDINDRPLSDAWFEKLPTSLVSLRLNSLSWLTKKSGPLFGTRFLGLQYISGLFGSDFNAMLPYLPMSCSLRDLYLIYDRVKSIDFVQFAKRLPRGLRSINGPELAIDDWAEFLPPRMEFLGWICASSRFFRSLGPSLLDSLRKIHVLL